MAEKTDEANPPAFHLTLEDHFASVALKKLIGSQLDASPVKTAQLAYEYAAAMMIERMD